ncbi:hypothetical protein [Sorangium sp. So ce693]
MALHDAVDRADQSQRELAWRRTALLGAPMIDLGSTPAAWLT